MLHAITHNKTNLQNRYLGHREVNEKRVREEDELTSLIMSPLSLLSDAIIKKFWKELVEWNTSGNLPLYIPEEPVENAKMHFWPRRKNKNTHIEPDMLIELNWATGEKRILLVEFKWKAPLSEKQLQKQWTEFLTKEERQLGYHIFMGLDISEGHKSLNDEDVWNGKLLLRSWFHVLTMLNQFNYYDEYSSFIEWSSQISSLLHKLNILSFNGFNNIGVNEVKYYNTNLLNLFQYKNNDELRHSIAHSFDSFLFFNNI